MKIQWDIFILKALFNKVKIITDFNSSRIKRKDIIKVGLFYSYNIYKYGYKINCFIDTLPVVFTFYDPLSKRNIDDINIYQTKFSYSMDLYNFQKEDVIPPKIKQVTDKIREIEKKYNWKVLVTNTIEQFPVFYDRYYLSVFLNNLIQKEETKQEFEQKFPKCSLKFPKTFKMEKLDKKLFKDKFNETKMKFPILIKSCLCVSVLSDYSHDILLIKNQEGLETMFEKYWEKVNKILPLVVQEMIDPLKFVNKIYYVYQKRVNKYFASIDLDQYGNFEYINGTKELKCKLKEDPVLSERDHAV